jgi:DNA (cytosine-5)-methyltransferase 1
MRKTIKENQMFKHLDLFSGIGGFSLGLERTGGFKTVAFCDNEPKTHLVLKKHWPDVPIFSDVKTLTGDQIGTVDIITGGFPCQDISLAGKGAGLAGERSGLWFEFHRLIQEIKPKWVIAENVAALRSRGLDQVLRSLFEIGYDAEWHCIPASAVGAPHRRDRIWIVAYPNNSGVRTQKHDINQKWTEIEQKREEQLHSWFGRLSKTMAYPKKLQRNGGYDNARVSMESETLSIRASSTEQEQSMPSGSSCIVRSITYSKVWEVEPNVGRVADGIPNRVDRLKQLGNAIVPQIAELLGQAILEGQNSVRND